MEIIIFSLLLVTVTITVMVYFGVNSKRKLITKLKRGFGKPPEDTDLEFESIKRYFGYKISNAVNNRIDSITWNDLDMDMVFARINTCHTSIGEEFLYDSLHDLVFFDKYLTDREMLISFLKEHPDERLKLQILLSGLSKRNYNGIASLIFDTGSVTLRYEFIYKILSLVPLLSIAVIPFSESGLLMLVASFLVNLVVYYRAKKKIDISLPVINYFSGMLSCTNKILKLDSLKSQPSILCLSESYSVFKSLKGKLPVMSAALSEMEALIEYIKILLLYDIRKYNVTLRKITKYSNEFHKLYRAIGEIDMSVAILSFRESLPFWSKPYFSDPNNRNIIRFSEIYHPLISESVANSGTITRSSILTGSNASGKSTFIKALAVNGILAQTINTCTAKEYEIRHSLIITSMAVRDDINAGESYFVVEIKSLKRILDRLEEKPICFIDEILRGTNTIERIAASASVLHYLGKSDCLCVTASHDIELTRILDGIYDNYHFCEQITDEGLFFDYKLKNGSSQTRNAIKLLNYMDYSKSITDCADELVRVFETSNSWPIMDKLC